MTRWNDDMDKAMGEHPETFGLVHDDHDPANAAAPPALDPVKCAICNDYSAAGVEVHEACLATPPALDVEAWAEARTLAALPVEDADIGLEARLIRSLRNVLAALSTGDKT